MDCLINYTDYNYTTMEQNNSVIDFSEFSELAELINEHPEYTSFETMGDYLFNT